MLVQMWLTAGGSLHVGITTRPMLLQAGPESMLTKFNSWCGQLSMCKTLSCFPSAPKMSSGNVDSDS